MKSSIKNKVIKQALAEYICFRATDLFNAENEGDLSKKTVRAALEEYVNLTYKNKSASKREKKMQRLIIEVTAAMTEFMRIKA